MSKLREITCEPPGQGIDDMLDDLRERHAKGEISALAIAVVFRDGSTESGFSHLPSINTMIGSVARLQHKLIHKLEFDE